MDAIGQRISYQRFGWTMFQIMSVTWQHLTIISTNNDWSKYNLLKMSLNMKGIWAIKHVWKSYIEVASDVFRSQFFNMPIMNSGFVFQWTLAAQQHQRAAPLSRNFVAKRKFSMRGCDESLPRKLPIEINFPIWSRNLTSTCHPTLPVLSKHNCSSIRSGVKMVIDGA